MSICPACKRQLPEGATVCLKCGADLRRGPILWFLTFGSVLVAAASVWMNLGR